MIDRENLEPVEIGGAVYISVPQSVVSVIYDYEAYHPTIIITKVGFGYHNQGWAYYEFKVEARTSTGAEEAANEILFKAMAEFQAANEILFAKAKEILQ